MQKIISDKSKALTTEDTAPLAMPRTSQASLQRAVIVSGWRQLVEGDQSRRSCNNIGDSVNHGCAGNGSVRHCVVTQM